MANLREETLNTYLALLLDQYDGISATAEIRSPSEAIDIMVTHRNATAAIPILIEAKLATLHPTAGMPPDHTNRKRGYRQ